jgi:alpha-galactosidase
MTPIDKTDLRAELIEEREYAMPSCEAMAYLQCGALDVRETLTGRGVMFLKLAPMPESRTDPAAVDFALNPSSRAVRSIPTGYPTAMLAYSGGEAGRLRALRDFHRSLWPYRPGRDGLILSNTWGDGNRDSRINEEFLLKEISAAADIGVEVVQIDDGWQKGRSKNSAESKGKGVWDGYWAADPEFWTPDRTRFPRGLDPLAEAAASAGLSIGLWFGPDSSSEAANWERDADCLLDYHRKFGIDHFKIDSLKLHTPAAFGRNRKFFGKMLRESECKMCFDLDCTAEVRPGFLGGMPVGPLFAENRYANRRSDRRVYHPHQTLRSLWSLAHLVDPPRLRMEFLNPAKKDETYGDDPLRPAMWPADALFAITMLSSPLAWMELSDVPEQVRAKWRPLMAKWKREREQLHGCTAVPVGGKPDGVAWTGFLSVGDDGKGYALIFREANARSGWRLGLEDVFGADGLTAEVLAGSGTAKVERGYLEVEIPEKLGYLWLSLR